MRKPIPKILRQRVLQRFDGACGYCGQKPKSLHVDHIVPVAHAHLHKIDINDESNLIPACASCNNYKMSHQVESFRKEIAAQVSRGREHCLAFRLAERYGLIEIKNVPVKFFFEKYNKDLK